MTLLSLKVQSKAVLKSKKKILQTNSYPILKMSLLPNKQISIVRKFKKRRKNLPNSISKNL
jgi:hypothetical protein